MYCSSCGAKNIDEARFCRRCGTSVLAAPSAPVTFASSNPVHSESDAALLRDRRNNRLARGIKQTTVGVGFLIVALALGFRGEGFGWLWIPGVILLVKGFSKLVECGASMPAGFQPRRLVKFSSGNSKTGSNRRAPRTLALSDSERFEAQAPPSVAENTTRIFDPVAKSARSGA
ncbi:MAG TPA: zinc ribbon domain-containing protein [Blastocatellia bacterium]|nr:zinc ribbon domain-containing protein [Blastocatellia bacterium]